MSIDYDKVLDSIDIFIGQRAGEVVDDHVLHLVAETIGDYNCSCDALDLEDIDEGAIAEHDRLFDKLDTCEKILGDMNYPWARRVQTMLNIYIHDQLGDLYGELNEESVEQAGVEIHSLDDVYTHFGLYDLEREDKPDNTGPVPVSE